MTCLRPSCLGTIAQRGGIVPQASDPPLPWAGRDRFKAIDGRTYQRTRRECDACGYVWQTGTRGVTLQNGAHDT